MPKWRFGVDINSSVDPTKWVLKIEEGGSQDRGLVSLPSGQNREGWAVLELVLLVNCWVAK